ncbi:MAG: restriction endonuclease subunit S [Actinomycetota bacterium]
MSRIDDLLRRHCPNGVEFQTLGDIGDLVRGNGIQKSDFTPEGVGCIHYGQIHTHYGTSATETKSFVSPELAARTRRALPGDLVIATTSEDDAAVGKAVAWLGAAPVAVSTDAFIFRHTLDPKYVSYFFQTADFRAQKQRHVTGTKVRRIGGSGLAQIRIPTPPLEVQHEIVRVLDLFESLEAELEAELEARRRQYAHYRALLMRLPDDVPRVPMGKIGEIFRGRRFTKQDYVPEGIGAIHYGELYTQYGVAASHVVTHVRAEMAAGLRFAQPGDVIIAEVGETVEDVGKATAWLGDTPVAIHDGCYGFRHSMNPKFVAYYMQTAEFQAEKNPHVARAKVKRLSLSGLMQVRIPVPSLPVQDGIVAVLDDFDELVNDLSIGLPAELLARRKQYEYYRDRLLTFEEAA